MNARGSHSTNHQKDPGDAACLRHSPLCLGIDVLAIRIGVHAVQSFLLAALRFTIAGVALFVWKIAKGEASLSRGSGSVLLIALPIFDLDYGRLFRTERSAPSGVAAVRMQTIPGFLRSASLTRSRDEAGSRADAPDRSDDAQTVTGR